MFLEHGTRRSRFRPLTGIVVLIGAMNCVNTDSTGCFRPLTGIVVLICEACSVAAERRIYHPTFPSPYGDCGSYRSTPRPLSSRRAIRFRPLTGIIVLIVIMGYDDEELVAFPSPYGDYSSYPVPPLSLENFTHPCFRPLTGIIVLIRTPYKWLHSAIENAFCGADFLFSSFFTFLRKMIFKNRPIADF